MIRADIEKLLKKTIGLDAASIGSSAVQRAIRTRVSACGSKDLHAYWEHLRVSESELQELVEAVVVPETWFFRDREAFGALVRIVSEGNLAGRGLRVLSLPCSTGEEPYSIAMALLDAGVPAGRFVIDAVDISERAVAYARRGIYGKNSFRGNDFAFRDRYFTQTEYGYQVAETVRRHVDFTRGNLFDANLLPSVELYDVIFCRNVLIYFDSPDQDRAVDLLSGLLTAQGVLFVGPSETNLLLRRDFVSTRLPLAFAFRKGGTLVTCEPAKARPAKRSHKAPRPVAPRPQPARELSGALPVQAPPSLVPEQDPGIDDIRRIADQGELAEAARRCEEYLRSGKPSAEAWHLLGLIRDAAGNPSEAADYYRKTLYLDPNHHEALVHLALLLEKQGNMSAAKVLNDRVRRLDRQVKNEHA
jgi:chemotaxis protein methyltransferase WspC